MLGNILPPFQSLQELNLDWILTKIKSMLRFLPDDGAVGQILRRTAHGAEWSNESAGGVSSVNGQTGDVVLDADDVGALPDTYTAPVTSVNTQTGDVVLSIPTDTSDLTNGAGFVDAAGAAAAAPVQSVNGLTGSVIARLPHFRCSTAAATVDKTVTGGAAQGVTSLFDGLAVIVYFENTNSATNPTFQIDNLPAAPMYQYGTSVVGTIAATTCWNAGSPVLLMYDGTGWVMNKGYNTNTTYTITDVLCATSASTAGKTASGTYFSLAGGDQLFEITFRYSNTKASKITLNINSTGVKDVWLDGAVTSSSNYSIKAGHYICRYDSVNNCYQLYSGGRINCDIIGTASGNYSPSNPPPYPVTSVNGQTGAVTISTSGVTVDLLWTNSDTSISFSPQIITTGDLSGYDFYAVQFVFSASNFRVMPISITPVTQEINQICITTLTNSNSGARLYSYEPDAAPDPGISFQEGHWNGSISNTYAIPYRIYGIKI